MPPGVSNQLALECKNKNKIGRALFEKRVTRLPLIFVLDSSVIACSHLFEEKARAKILQLTASAMPLSEHCKADL